MIYLFKGDVFKKKIREEFIKFYHFSVAQIIFIQIKILFRINNNTYSVESKTKQKIIIKL